MLKFTKIMSAFGIFNIAFLLISCAGDSDSHSQLASNPTSQPALSAQAVQNQKHFNLSDGVALDGYDPVSYFDGEPLEGEESITADFEGITYQFASESNKEKFLADPQSYEPAYGGWCAWAVADGSKYKVDPETYKIQDGRLLLFYKGLLGDTLKKWEDGNEDELLMSADGHWVDLSAD